MNIKNLKKMADYIETIPQARFDMSAYRKGQKKTAECKSIGCVIGHCTILDADNVMANYLYDDGKINFSEWSEYFTGINIYRKEWDWCFGEHWAKVDNTPTGAAKRIRYFIENGLPENWDEQMKGAAPLCY